MEAKSYVPVSFRNIVGLLAAERREIAAIYFFAILNGLIQLSLPLGVQSIIGFVLGASVRASMIILIVLVVLGVLMAGMMQVSQMKLIEKIQQKLFVRYAFAFMNHIPTLDLKKNDNIYLPELTNRFFDVPVLQKSLAKILLDIPIATIQILFGLILLSFYHAGFIVFGLLLIGVLILILKYTGYRGLETSIDESTYKFKTAAWIQETARVIKSIKLAKSNDLHLHKLDDQVSNYLTARNSHFRVLLFQYHVLVIFKTLITAAMLVIGTYLLVEQQLNIGQFVAAEIVIIMVLNSVEKLIINIASVYDTLTAKEKISSVTEKASEPKGQMVMQPSARGVSLEMKNLSFSYDDVKNVLQDVSINIKANDRVCIRGRDSSGKSTLLRIMAGAYTDFKGAFLLDDVPVANYDLDSLRSQTGVLFNQQDIFHGSMWHNITLGNETITLEDVRETARRTGLNDYIASLPNGYDTLLDPTGNRLSRSATQKILLVRALVSRPRLLLLEEPWINYDNNWRKQIMQLILEQRNTTLVVITEDEDYCRQCDKIILLSDEGKASVIINNKS